MLRLARNLKGALCRINRALRVIPCGASTGIIPTRDEIFCQTEKQRPKPLLRNITLSQATQAQDSTCCCPYDKSFPNIPVSREHCFSFLRSKKQSRSRKRRANTTPFRQRPDGQIATLEPACNACSCCAMLGREFREPRNATSPAVIRPQSALRPCVGKVTEAVMPIVAATRRFLSADQPRCRRSPLAKQWVKLRGNGV